MKMQTIKFTLCRWMKFVIMIVNVAVTQMNWKLRLLGG